MKNYPLPKSQTPRTIALAAGVALAFFWWSAGGLAHAQTTPANLSPGLQEIVRLAQAHISDDVITAYVRNSGASYSLTADDILYLNSQGVSQTVMSALMQTKSVAPTMPPATIPQPSTPAPAIAPQPMAAPDAYLPPPPPPPGSPITLDYFQSQLAPYGNWEDVPPYGPCWRPAEDLTVPGWRPYFNRGHWEYTDSGWFWQSDYPYGDVVFHYGRWIQDFRYGWVWVPGYDFAPSWVAWRESGGYCGWAPLPPGARFEVGVGLMFHGALAVDVDFGLAPDAFVFVGFDHFWDHDYRPFLVPRDRAFGLFRASIGFNHYNIVDGRFVVEGLGRDRMAALTHHDVRAVHITLHDDRIMRSREIERTRSIARVQEIRSRPAGDPLRNTLDRRDAVRPAVAPRRVEEPAKPSETPGRSGRDGRDSRDSRGDH